MPYDQYVLKISEEKRHEKKAMRYLVLIILCQLVSAEADREIEPQPDPDVLTFEEVYEYFENDDHEGLLDELDRDGDGVVDGTNDGVWDYIERLYLRYDYIRSRELLLRQQYEPRQQDTSDPISI